MGKIQPATPPAPLPPHRQPSPPRPRAAHWQLPEGPRASMRSLRAPLELGVTGSCSRGWLLATLSRQSWPPSPPSPLTRRSHRRTSNGPTTGGYRRPKGPRPLPRPPGPRCRPGPCRRRCPAAPDTCHSAQLQHRGLCSPRGGDIVRLCEAVGPSRRARAPPSPLALGPPARPPAPPRAARAAYDRQGREVIGAIMLGDRIYVCCMEYELLNPR